MGLKVLALDINSAALEEAKNLGADLVFNTSATAEVLQKVQDATHGGVHAAAVFSGALPAFATATQCLKLNGLLMVVGMPSKPLPVDALDLIAGRYRIKGESTGIPQRMKKAVAFTALHNIQPRVSRHSLSDVPGLFQQMKAGDLNTKAVVIF
jgi:propanol-preferring alcohol dehydrogenase